MDCSLVCSSKSVEYYGSITKMSLSIKNDVSIAYVWIVSSLYCILLLAVNDCLAETRVLLLGWLRRETS